MTKPECPHTNVDSGKYADEGYVVICRDCDADLSPSRSAAPSADPSPSSEVTAVVKEWLATIKLPLKIDEDWTAELLAADGRLLGKIVYPQEMAAAALMRDAINSLPSVMVELTAAAERIKGLEQKYAAEQKTREAFERDKYATAQSLFAAESTVSELRAEVERLTGVLAKINDIRNSIVGCQTFNWSEHAYPLVAALGEAGIEGLPYPEARANVGTLIERTNKAEADRNTLQAKLGAAEARAPKANERVISVDDLEKCLAAIDAIVECAAIIPIKIKNMPNIREFSMRIKNLACALPTPSTATGDETK